MIFDCVFAVAVAVETRHAVSVLSMIMCVVETRHALSLLLISDADL